MTHVSKASLLFVSLVALAGCMKDEPSSGGGSGQTANSIEDESEGSFTTTSSKPLENGSVPADMELGPWAHCASLPDDQKDDYGWDPRSIVGDVFTGRTSIADTKGAITISYSNSISEKSPTKLVTRSVWTNILVNPNPGPIPPSVTMVTTCTNAPDDYPECSMEFENMPPSTGGGTSNDFYCTFSQTGDTTGLAERGSYTMKSGQTVNALRVTRTNPVTIKCKDNDTAPEQDYGTGLSQSVTITTRDLVEASPMNCYSNRHVYSYSAHAQDGGNVMNVMKDEIFSAPIR